MIPVQGIVGLAQVEEDIMDKCLPQDGELPKKLCLEGGGTRSSLGAK